MLGKYIEEVAGSLSRIKIDEKINSENKKIKLRLTFFPEQEHVFVILTKLLNAKIVSRGFANSTGGGFAAKMKTLDVEFYCANKEISNTFGIMNFQINTSTGSNAIIDFYG